MRAKSRKSRQHTTPFRFLSNIDAQPSTSEGNIGKPLACHNAFMAFLNSNFEQFPNSRSSYGRKWTLSASVNQVSGCCQDFVVVIVVTDSSSSRVMRYDAFGNKASRSRFLSGETLPTMRQHSSTILRAA